MTEDSKSKQRLVGAIVLLSLAVIFLPALVDFNSEPHRPVDMLKVPPAPPYRDYQSRVVPIEIPPPVVDVDDQGAVSRSTTGVLDAAADSPRATDPVASSPNYEAAVPAARPSPVALPDKGWAVQVATFSTLERAKKISEQLQKLGFVAYIEPVKTAKGLMQRVRLGPEFDREKAEELQRRLQKSTEFKGMVLRFP